MKTMKIYLQYLTREDGTRMSKFAFQKICTMLDWNAPTIQAFFTKAGWKFDEDYGFTFEEVVEHMFVSLHANTTASQMAGYNQACEGRR